MVQKEKARRGRPRAYDPDVALTQAMNAFWDAGYAGTSLDDLTAATGMNRPSLYAAFGDKQAIYRKALEHYRANARETMKGAFAYDLPLREALRSICDSALSIYFSDGRRRGCFVYGSAITEAVLDADTRATLAEVVRQIDRALESRIRFAQTQGELPADARPEVLAKMVAAVLASLSIRSRAGEPRESLEAIAESMLDLICGPSRAAN
jgi:AcrR family transcriptional regulator